MMKKCMDSALLLHVWMMVVMPAKCDAYFLHLCHGLCYIRVEHSARLEWRGCD